LQKDLEHSKSFCIFVGIFKVMKFILKRLSPNALTFFYQNVTQDPNVAIFGALFISIRELKK